MSKCVVVTRIHASILGLSTFIRLNG